MPVYDLSSGFRDLGAGIDSLAAAQQAQQKRNALAVIGDAINRGDYKAATAGLLGSGDISNGIGLLKVQKDADKDAASLSTWNNGPGGVPAAPAAAGIGSPVASNDAAAAPGAIPKMSAGNGPIPELAPVVQAATKQYNLDPSYVGTTLAVESAGGRNLGSRGNAGQFDQGTADEIGIPNATTDPAASVTGTGALAAKRGTELVDRIGRPPSPAEVYLAHQQGTGGAAALLNADPGKTAADVLGSVDKVRGNLPASLQDQAGTMSAQAFANFQTGRWNAMARALGYTPGNSIFASSDQQAAPQQSASAAPATVGGQGKPGYLPGVVPGGAAPIQLASNDTGFAPAPVPVQRKPIIAAAPQQAGALGAQVSQVAAAGAPSGASIASVAPQQQVPVAQAPAVVRVAPNPNAFQAEAPGVIDDEDDKTKAFDLSDAEAPTLAWARANAAKYGYQEDAANPGSFVPAAAGAQVAAGGAPGAAPQQIVGAQPGPQPGAPAADVPQQQPAPVQVAPAVDKSLGIVQQGGLPAWITQPIAATKPGTPERSGALLKAAGIAASLSAGGGPAALAAAAAKPTLDAAIKAEQDASDVTRVLAPDDAKARGFPALPKGEVYQIQGGKISVLDTRDTEASAYTPIAEDQKKLYPGAVAVDNTGKPLYPPKGQTINVGGEEGAESKESGKLAAQRRGDLVAAADKAPENIARLRLLGQVLDSTKSGQFAGTLATIGGYASAIGMSPERIKALGLDPNAATSADMAQKLAGELVVGSIGAKNGGFPASNFSIAERQFIEKMFPSIQNQPGANQAVTDVLVAREQRILQKADEWAAYKDQQRADSKPVSYEDFEDQFRRAHAGENIFAPIQQKFEKGGYGPTGSNAPGLLPNTNSKAGAVPGTVTHIWTPDGGLQPVPAR